MKRKMLVTIILILTIITATSCTTTSKQSYLEFLESKNPIIKQNEPYALKFFAINPTPNTFTGTIEYDYDEKCLQTSSKSDTIEITPQSYKQAMIKTFSYTQSYYRNSESNECFQKPIKITTTIKDKGGDIKGQFDVLLTIVA